MLTYNMFSLVYNLMMHPLTKEQRLQTCRWIIQYFADNFLFGSYSIYCTDNSTWLYFSLCTSWVSSFIPKWLPHANRKQASKANWQTSNQTKRNEMKKPTTMANIFLRFSSKLKQAAAGLSVHDRQIKIPNGSVCRSISKPGTLCLWQSVRQNR